MLPVRPSSSCLHVPAVISPDLLARHPGDAGRGGGVDREAGVRSRRRRSSSRYPCFPAQPSAPRCSHLRLRRASDRGLRARRRAPGACSPGGQYRRHPRRARVLHAHGVIERSLPGADIGQSKQGADQDDVVLIAAVGGPRPLLPVQGADRRQHHRDERRLREWRSEPEGEQGTAAALGLATPLAEAPLISVMLTAIRTLHWKKGPWATNGGYEYNVVLISALLGLADGGPGKWSLDNAVGMEHSGAAWMAAVLAAGAAGSWGATAGAQPAVGGAPQPEV